jgi:hypothetical protein
MDTSVNQEQTTAGARAAAEWWAEQIGHPIHKVVDDNATGDERFTGDFAFMAMQIVSGRHPVGDDAAHKFVEELSGRQRGGFNNLGVDYGPDRQLAESADAAGIHYSRFPFKTHMWIRPDHVTAALGYHGVTRIVWSAPDWVRPACGTHQYDDEWNALGPVCSKPIYHEDEHGDWIPDPQRCKECGGSYVDHYGREAKSGERCLYWEPTS